MPKRMHLDEVGFQTEAYNVNQHERKGQLSFNCHHILEDYTICQVENLV